MPYTAIPTHMHAAIAAKIAITVTADRPKAAFWRCFATGSVWFCKLGSSWGRMLFSFEGEHDEGTIGSQTRQRCQKS